VKARIAEAQQAFSDWRDCTRLPQSVDVDKASDLTLLYVNNTIYGEFTDGGLLNFPRWQERGATLKVTLYNLLPWSSRSARWAQGKADGASVRAS